MATQSERQRVRSAAQMIPGASLVSGATSVGQRMSSAANRRPNAASAANQAQSDSDMRIARLQAQSQSQRAAGNHGDADDTDAFIAHLRSQQQPTKSVTAKSPALAQRRNALAGMGR